MKKMNNGHKHSFTLVELLVVMMVIAVLVGITLPVAKYVSWRINYEREKVMVNEIHDALDEYRLLYGEYPVPGSEKHYPKSYFVDPSNYLPAEYQTIDLTDDPVETLDFSTTKTVDYSLTWPLMLGPESRGERPYMSFPEATVMYLVYDNPVQSIAKKTKKLIDGGQETRITGYYLSGNPINRYLAIAPTTGNQWKYECSDGVVYPT